MMKAIDIQRLNKTYAKKFTKKVQALADVTFEVEEGSVFGFIGPNGAGKSTTIKIIMGLLRPSSGEVLLYDCKSTDPKSRSKVGYLAENPSYYDYLTPRELLMFVGENFGVGRSLLKQKIGEVLEQIELQKAADRPIRNLSKGMVQRIGLGQTLVHDPDLYILDEPMSGLDPLGRRLVSDIILRLREKGKTVFFSTHIIHDVERICDDVAILLDGELKFCGPVKKVLDESFERYEVLLKGELQEQLDLPNVETIQVWEESGHYRLLIPREIVGVTLPRLLQHSEILLMEPERRSLEQTFMELAKNQRSYGN